jgi:hypothetical protein
VVLLRRAGRLPYQHIADLTRWMRKPRTFNSVDEALQASIAERFRSIRT